MFSTLGRVYDNAKARNVLGWEPEYTFQKAIELLSRNLDHRSALAREVGSKAYHSKKFEDGPYPVSGF